MDPMGLGLEFVKGTQFLLSEDPILNRLWLSLALR